MTRTLTGEWMKFHLNIEAGIVIVGEFTQASEKVECGGGHKRIQAILNPPRLALLPPTSISFYKSTINHIDIKILIHSGQI